MIALALALTASAETPAPAPAPAPSADGLAPCTVLLPTFTANGKNVTAGTMFATKVGDREVLVTAHSVFGPGGGLPAQLSPDQVVQQVTAATAYDSLSPKVTCARTRQALKVADAAPGSGNDTSKDVAVFAVDHGEGPNRLSAVAPVPLTTLPLAAQPAKLDEDVWLLAAVNGKTGGKWAAKVVQATDTTLFIEYTDRSLDLAGTVGAAIVNAKGEVVGLNVGSGKMDDGALIGSATPLAPLKKRITEAAAAK
ncbi:MAG: hypothetical protein R3F59_06635 [Myxococcota bacterium]